MKKIGRPKKSGELKRQVNMSMTKSEVKMVDSQSKKSGFSRSSYVVKLVSDDYNKEDGLKNRDDIIKKLRSSLKKSDEIIKKLQDALDARAEFMSKSGDMDHKIVKSCEVLKKLESIKGES